MAFPHHQVKCSKNPLCVIFSRVWKTILYYANCIECLITQKKEGSVYFLCSLHVLHKLFLFFLLSLCTFESLQWSQCDGNKCRDTWKQKSSWTWMEHLHTIKKRCTACNRYDLELFRIWIHMNTFSDRFPVYRRTDKTSEVAEAGPETKILCSH